MDDPPDLYLAALDALGYAPRPQQAELVRLLREGGDRVAVQAGTGVGKSVAALTEAARRGKPGSPAVIVTMTIALTAQYAYQDAPAVAEAIGMSFTRVVGRSHYLCASSAAGGFGSEPPIDDADGIALWVEGRNRWLDREASPGLPECSRWELDRQVHDETYACPGSCGGRSYGGCGARRARERGNEVQVIITNAHCLVYHHRYPFAGILPDEIAYVLVDEAHQLPDTVSGTLSAEVTPGFGTVWAGADHTPAVQVGGVPADVAHTVSAELAEVDECLMCRRDQDHYVGMSVTDVTTRFVECVQQVREELCAQVRWAETWSPEVRVAATAGQCERIRAAAADYHRWCEAIAAGEWGAPVPPRGDDDPEPDESPGVLEVAELLALTAGMPNVVATVAREEPDTVRLTRTKVAQASARYLGPRAALITGTMPRTLTARVGWPDVTPHDVGHPFDYAGSVRGWISRHSGVKTPPRRLSGQAREQWLKGLERTYAARADELDRFIGRERGLVLVPSHADTEVLRRHLVPRLAARGVPVFVQPKGGGSRRAREQVQLFVATAGPAVLIGTDSLATGVDLPGDLLTRVAWWCLPKGFTSPADEQRELLYPGYADDRLRIKVAQGIGRLLRRESDTGMVLLCDERFGQHVASATGLMDRHLREIPWRMLRVREAPPVESRGVDFRRLAEQGAS